MPHHKSCAKRLRQAARERIQNNAVRTAMKVTMKGARAQLEEGTPLDLNATFSKIDKVSSKGVIHKKKASRLKSRLAKANAKLQASKG